MSHYIAVPYSDLTVHVMDEPTHGGAHHEYEIRDGEDRVLCKISFQNGPIKDHGVNGVSNEALLIAVSHRLRSFQSGPYVSEYNRIALDHIDQANEALFNRTRERQERGVEGTHQL